MTVADLKKELEFYDDDMEVQFDLEDKVEVESWTENKYGDKEVYIDKDLKPTFISEMGGKMRIELGVVE